MSGQRHYHGATLHAHDGGDAPHGHGPFSAHGYVLEGLREAVGGFGRALAVILISVAVFAGWHVVPAWLARDNPPLACQIDGGQWSPWGGWSCG